MEEFGFAPWVLDRENDKMLSVYRWGSRTGRSGLRQIIRVALTLGKGDNPSMLEIYDDDTDEVQSVECNDLPDLLNKMESCLADY